MTRAIRVALLGFNAFDRAAITTGLRLNQHQATHYQVVQGIDDSELMVADADHQPAVQLVLVTERLADTVFVGEHRPPGAVAGIHRPIDSRLLVRELDRLRAAREPPGPLEPAAVPPLAPGETPPSALIVDDSETARRALAMRLERYGFLVEVAAHSGQALAMISRRRFDGLFIDVDLGPESAFDGFALCQQIKRHPRPGRGPPPWVGMVTGLDSPSDRVRGSLAGCDAYLTKPVDEAELLHLLRREGWVRDLQDS